MRKFLIQEYDNQDKVLLKVSKLKIEYENFSLTAPRLTLSAGEFLILEGENGSGKSSLLKALAGLENNYTGSILLKRNLKLREQKSFNSKELASTITYLPQVYRLVELRVFDFLLHARFPFVKTYMGFTHEDFIEVEAVLKMLDIEYLRESFFHKLSGGEQVKVLIARMMILNADIILLDEPTAFLDAKARAMLLELIKTLLSKKKCVLVSTHDTYLFKDIKHTRLRVI